VHASRSGKTNWLTALGLGVALLLAAGGYQLFRGGHDNGALERIRTAVAGKPARIRVEVVHPQKGGIDRVTVQPCSVHSFEVQKVFAEVSGYLKIQNVDIGAQVHSGDVLAVIDVPELAKQVDRNRAAVDQAQARVRQMNARVDSANADWQAALADVTWSQAKVDSAKAWSRFRGIQLGRFSRLVKLDSVEQKLKDEYQENYEAAKEAERAAVAGVAHSNALVLAMAAKIKQAEADVVEAKAEVEVARAELEKAQELLGFATLKSKYTGVVSQRSLCLGDFVRAASAGGAQQEPLLTVQRTDLLRVVVQVPSRDVPYTDAGDLATIELDDLPGLKFQAPVARTAGAQDPNTRLMRVEIDVPNPDGRIKPGMFGRATIQLERAPDRLSLPLPALFHKTEDGKAEVFVIRDGKAWLVPVRTGSDDGVRVAILQGLSETAWVVTQPAGGLSNGARVEIPAAPPAPSPAGKGQS
jgi:RND family efflux transporter MFP subunit